MLVMIENINRKTQNEILTEEGITKSFRTERRVRQGCPLGPTLFNIFTEDIEEEWTRNKKGGSVVRKTIVEEVGEGVGRGSQESNGRDSEKIIIGWCRPSMRCLILIITNSLEQSSGNPIN